jgi:hypothetical protein
LAVDAQYWLAWWVGDYRVSFGANLEVMATGMLHGTTAPSAMISPMEQRHVKLSGDIEGSYVIEEALADGRFVVAPEWPSKETSAEAILERAGGERMSPEAFDKHFGHLPTDGEG